MFFKNELRPQMAFAGAADSSFGATKKRRYDSMTFASAESSDFGAFGYESSGRFKGTGGNRKKKKSFDGFDLSNPKVLTIAIVAAVLVLAIVIGGLVMLFSNLNLSGNVLYEDNAYMAYQNSEGKTYVLANGKLVKQDFDGEVQLIPAKDNSFAYVFDNIDGEIYMYVINGSKIERVSDRPATRVLAWAGLEPGILFETGSDKTETNKYNIYSDKYGTQTFTTGPQAPDNFILSDDAETAIFTTKKDRNSSDNADRVLTIFRDGVEDKITPENGASCIPVAVSKDGRYVYNVRTNSNGNPMLWITDINKKQSWDIPNSEHFLCIAEMNVKGDEVLFCTGTGLNAGETATLENVLEGGFSDVSTSLYRHKAPEDNLTTYIGKNVVVKANKDTDVAIYKSFLDKYLTTLLPADSDDSSVICTFHIDKKYVVQRIAETTSYIDGQFSPDGKYFYFVDKNEALKMVDLKDRLTTNAFNAGNVSAFAVTKKGNLFILDSEDNSICYIKKSTQKQIRYNSDNFDSMSFHDVANKVYFTNGNSEESSVWIAEEGKEEHVAKFGSLELNTIPYFSTTYGKKCYAAVVDTETGNISIYYSSNGSRFKLTDASGCTDISYGLDIDMIAE